MSISKFLTLPRRVADCCWTLVALAILAAPGLAWGDDCNDSGSISKSPGGVYALGQTVRFTYFFGSEGNTTQGLVLTVDNDEVLIALDCDTAATGADRENCLGYNGGVLAAAANDGDAIAFGGNLDSGNSGRCSNDSFLTCAVDADCASPGTCDNIGSACSALTFSVAPGHGDGNPVETTPNVLVVKADDPIQFERGEGCWVAFDARVNSIGLEANWEAGDQFVNASAGFTGQCTPDLGADSTKSTNYQIAITPDIAIRKEVSLDGGAWFDANVGPFPIGIVPSSTAEYRLIVENVGEEALDDVKLSDNTPPFFLGLTEVALPTRCLVPQDASGFFLVGATCTIISGDSGFGALGSPPVAVCATEGTKTNWACVNSTGAATGAIVPEQCDPATVECLKPDIEVTKDGPEDAKVGDTIEYSICATNTGATDLNNCIVTDVLLGLAAAPFPDLAFGATNVCLNPAPTYVIPGGAPDPLLNTATVTCDVVGSASATVSDFDGHSVNLFTTEIDVRKSGPTEAKAGDTIDYVICATNLSSADAPEFDGCTVTDSLIGLTAATFPIPVIGGGEVCMNPDPTYSIPVDATGFVDNRADVTCTLADYDNAPTDFDTHRVPLFVVEGNMSKTCTPDPVKVGEQICWDITVNNTGDKDFDCKITDIIVGLDEAELSVPAGGSNSLAQVCRTVLPGEEGTTISNTASADCSPDGYDNEITIGDTADCEVERDVDELCRTPGFWKTHAGEEKAGRSSNLTQIVIDSTSGNTLGNICGDEITDTWTNNYPEGTGYDGGTNGANSAVEGMCVHPKQQIIRQLQRQLIAAALNCVVSGGGADCTGVSVEQDWQDANADCTANTGNLSGWVDIIDDFNNGLYEGSNCSPNIKESPVFDGVDKVPGPAGSSNACSEATYNDFYLVP